MHIIILNENNLVTFFRLTYSQINSFIVFAAEILFLILTVIISNCNHTLKKDAIANNQLGLDEILAKDQRRRIRNNVPFTDNDSLFLVCIILCLAINVCISPTLPGAPLKLLKGRHIPNNLKCYKYPIELGYAGR